MTTTITPTEPTLAQLRADAVQMLSISRNQAKKLSREQLLERLDKAAANDIHDADEKVVAVAEKIVHTAAKRPVRFTYTLADGSAARANFATVENAQTWGEKAKERGDISAFQVVAA